MNFNNFNACTIRNAACAGKIAFPKDSHDNVFGFKSAHAFGSPCNNAISTGVQNLMTVPCLWKWPKSPILRSLWGFNVCCWPYKCMNVGSLQFPFGIRYFRISCCFQTFNFPGIHSGSKYVARSALVGANLEFSAIVNGKTASNACHAIGSGFGQESAQKSSIMRSSLA